MINVVYAIVLVNLILLLCFWSIYHIIYTHEHFTIDTPPTWYDSLFYTTSMQVSAGVDGVSPKSKTAKLVSSVHQIIVSGLFMGIIALY